jgi:hypothetical protein
MVQGKGAGAILLIALAVTHAGGCSSTSRGEKMEQSFARTRQTVAEGQREVDLTLMSLDAMRRGRPEPQEAFKRYRDAVGRLEEEGKDAKKRAVAMQGESETHIRAWQAEMETFKDPTIKASLESRRQAVRSNFKLVKMYAEDARKAYGPFLQGNKELVRALSIDLSPASVTSLGPAMDKVLGDGQALKERLAALQHALDNIANGVSPIGLGT